MTAFHYIILTHLFFGMGLGIIMHRSDFCIAGMFRDLFLLNDYYKMRSLFMLVVLTSMLLYISRMLGIVASYPPSFFGTPSMANLLGGAIFGTGMVLAGGCTIGTLYKMGAGNLVSVFSFAGILLGSMLFAEFYSVNLLFAEATVFIEGKTSAEHITGDPGLLILIIGLISAFLFYRWNKEKKWTQKTYARGHLYPWKAAILIVFIIMLSYIISGRPLSVTSGYARLAAHLEAQFFPAHTAKLRFFNEDSPRLLYGAVMSWRHRAGLADPVAATQVPMIIGVVLGSFLSSATLREFRINHFPPKRQIFSALSGGIMMAVGSLMAGGCNVWHIMGGLPVIAFQSLLFLAGITAGAYFGTNILKKVII